MSFLGGSEGARIKAGAHFIDQASRISSFSRMGVQARDDRVWQMIKDCKFAWGRRMVGINRNTVPPGAGEVKPDEDWRAAFAASVFRAPVRFVRAGNVGKVGNSDQATVGHRLQARPGSSPGARYLRRVATNL